MSTSRSLLLVAASLLLIAAAAPADRPLGPPQRHSVRSPDGRFEAVSDPATHTTAVYRLGETGERERQWAMVGWFRVLHLANGGEHLVIGHEGANLLPKDVKDDEILLRFVRRGELLAQVTLKELVADRSALRPTVSHLAWRSECGFDAEGAFFVDTVDGRRHRFDPATGQPTQEEGTEKEEQTASLILLTRMAPGDTYWNVVWSQGEQHVKAQVYHAYNLPTGDSSYRGDFRSVIEAITGQPATGKCQDPQEIFQAAEKVGWKQVKRSRERIDKGSGHRTTVLYRRALR